MLWCLKRDWVNKEPTGPVYRSHIDWQKAIHSIPVLDDQYFGQLAKLLDINPSAYPFISVHQAVHTLFFSCQSDADKLSFRRKSCLFGYFLMDAGFIEDLRGFHQSPFEMEVGEIHLIQGHVYFNRYKYFDGGRGNLQQSISQFQLAVPAVPFSTIELLTREGFSGSALLIWQGQHNMQDVASLQQFRIILQAWLNGQGPQLALNAIRSYYKLRPEEDMSKLQNVLLRDILDWGLANDQMDSIVDLPLSKEEENIYEQWVIHHWDDDSCCASYPLFCLTRLRTLDAVKALHYRERCGRLLKVSGGAYVLLCSNSGAWNQRE